MTRSWPSWLPRGLTTREQQQYATQHGVSLLRVLWACGEIVDTYRFLHEQGARTTTATIALVDHCRRNQ